MLVFGALVLFFDVMCLAAVEKLDKSLHCGVNFLFSAQATAGVAFLDGQRLTAASS